jgi:class 3 adenylate cyclase
MSDAEAISAPATPAQIALPPAAARAPERGPRSSLLRKYIVALVGLVAMVLCAHAGVEFWFSYRASRAGLLTLQQEKADAAAQRIGEFVTDIERQIGWTTLPPWGAAPLDQRRFDFARLLRQVPAITDLTELDGAGKEHLKVSRLTMDVVGSGADFSHTPEFVEPRASGTWFGPVYFRKQSEPYMTLAMAHAGHDAGVTVASINLKFIWDVITALKIGEGGYAYVVDSRGKLIAAPDISLVLRDTDLSRLQQVAAALSSRSADGRSPEAPTAAVALNYYGRSVLSAHARVKPLGWRVFVEVPLSEAYAPLYALALRDALWLLLAVTGAALAAFLLARHMTGPIRVLEHGAGQIGAGNFNYKIEISTGDELQQLAERFNEMAAGLAESRERSERIARLKQFLSPQVAEILEKSDQAALLDSHRREIVVLFCDLRGFTSFASMVEPDSVMRLLQEYYEALGIIITRYEATLTCFMADGLMLLLNAPVPCPKPALRGARMALDMQASVKRLIAGWQARGHAIGFGVALAMGPATVGRIGYEGRSDYTAIGNVVNLAARMCGAAEDGQILIDAATAAEIGDAVCLVSMGTRSLRGFNEPVPVLLIAPQPQAPVPTGHPLVPKGVG